ncbi:MAG: glycosyltransferase [Bacillota bacterium]|nr:glycosyltransferase [Bacillota bacterium]
MKWLKQPLISLCMIVKNEESNILRCLDSVKDYVDEILVLDTGSGDRTPVLAQEQGACVFFGRWENNFAKARNEIKQQARGEWIFYLDADEELPPETGRSLRQLAQQTKAEALQFSIVNYTSSSDTQKCRGLNIRMFKNNPNYYFEGALHEQIAPSILRVNPSAAIVCSGLEILHYGYSFDHPRRIQKNQRNITILESMLAENPKDDFTHYNLGVSLYVGGQLENAKRHFQLAKQYANKKSHYLPALYRNFTACLVDLGEYEEALKLAQEGLSHFPDYPDLYYLQGQIYSITNLFELALERFKQCLKYNKLNPNYISMDGVQSFLAYEQLADIYMHQQKWEDALQHQLKAVQNGTASYTSFLRLGLLAKQHFNNSSDAIDFLDCHLPKLRPEERIKLLFDMGEHHLALQKTEMLPQPLPYEIYIIALKSAIYLKNWQRAKMFLSQTSPLDKEIPTLAAICHVLDKDAVKDHCETDQLDQLLAKSIYQKDIPSEEHPFAPLFLDFAFQLIGFDDFEAVNYFETVINPLDLPLLYSQLGQRAFLRKNYNLAERLFALSLACQKKGIHYRWFGLMNVYTGDKLEGIRLIRHSCNLENDSQNYIFLLTAVSDFFQHCLRHLVVNCPHIPKVHQHLLGLAGFKKKLIGKEEIDCQ